MKPAASAPPTMRLRSRWRPPRCSPWERPRRCQSPACSRCPTRSTRTARAGASTTTRCSPRRRRLAPRRSPRSRRRDGGGSQRFLAFAFGLALPEALPLPVVFALGPFAFAEGFAFAAAFALLAALDLLAALALPAALALGAFALAGAPLPLAWAEGALERGAAVARAAGGSGVWPLSFLVSDPSWSSIA